jgi:glutathione S-transferase
VNPYKKEPHFLAINPKGLVPAFEYHGKALYESLVLIDFLEDAYPADPKSNIGASLYPADPYDRAYARIWIDHISKAFTPAYMRLVQAQEKQAQDAAREELYKALRTISEKWKGPYFLGDQFGVVDIAIAPWITRWYVIEENRGATHDAVSPQWKAWAENLAKRESVVKTQSVSLCLVPFTCV